MQDTVRSSNWNAGYEDGYNAREAEKGRGRAYMAGYRSGEADLTEDVASFWSGLEREDK